MPDLGLNWACFHKSTQIAKSTFIFGYNQGHVHFASHWQGGLFLQMYRKQCQIFIISLLEKTVIVWSEAEFQMKIIFKLTKYECRFSILSLFLKTSRVYHRIRHILHSSMLWKFNMKSYGYFFRAPKGHHSHGWFL